MCGIIFVADQALVPVPGDAALARKLAALESARDLMATRGPDRAGAALVHHPDAGAVWLGHRRLSIVDLSEAGDQPMWSDDRRFVITFNGEIYNAVALRKELVRAGRRFRSLSDTEVIVTGFAEWGERIVDRLIGMFAFAIWDETAGRLFAARDRLGIKPFHYVASEQRCAIASDARSLCALGLVKGYDCDALGAYLALGYVPAPMSIWQRAAKLPAGHTLAWAPGMAPVLRTYWEAPDDSGRGGSPTASLAAFEALLDTVVADHMIADVPMGLFLSGGIDSSVIAASAAREFRPGDIGAFTIGLPRADESPVAEETARRLGLPWTRLAITTEETGLLAELAEAAMDEPLAYTAVIPQYVVSRAAARHGRVVLSGDGGDEVFGGYRWYKRLRGGAPLFVAKGLLASRVEAAVRALFSGRPSADTRARIADARFAGASPLHGHLRRVFPGLLPSEIGDLFATVSPARAEEGALAALRRHDAPRLPFKRRMQRIDLMTFCQDAVLSKVDRTAMAFGLEVRPPLLDHRVVEWGIARPLSPLDDAAPKGVLREIARRRGLDHLLAQPKRGFSLAGASRLKDEAMVAVIDRLRGESAGQIRLSDGWRSRLPAAGSASRNRLETLHLLTVWDETVRAPAVRGGPAATIESTRERFSVPSQDRRHTPDP